MKSRRRRATPTVPGCSASLRTRAHSMPPAIAVDEREEVPSRVAHVEAEDCVAAAVGFEEDDTLKEHAEEGVAESLQEGGLMMSMWTSLSDAKRSLRFATEKSDVPASCPPIVFLFVLFSLIFQFIILLISFIFLFPSCVSILVCSLTFQRTDSPPNICFLTRGFFHFSRSIIFHFLFGFLFRLPFFHVVSS